MKLSWNKGKNEIDFLKLSQTLKLPDVSMEAVKSIVNSSWFACIASLVIMYVAIAGVADNKITNTALFTWAVGGIAILGIMFLDASSKGGNFSATKQRQIVVIRNISIVALVVIMLAVWSNFGFIGIFMFIGSAVCALPLWSWAQKDETRNKNSEWLSVLVSLLFFYPLLAFVVVVMFVEIASLGFMGVIGVIILLVIAGYIKVVYFSPGEEEEQSDYHQ